MKAVRNAPPSVEVVDVDEPEGEGELVRVVATEIYASDLKYLRWGSTQIAGHEFAGVLPHTAGRLQLHRQTTGSDHSGIEHLGITRLSDVEPKQVDWLWHKRLPKGKVVVLDGDPEIGKSTLAINLAAVVTTGGSWPDGRECRYPGNVVMLSGEDGTADTLVPRVMAAGGRRDRFFQYEGVKYKGADGQTYVRMSTLDLPGCL